MYSLSTNRRIVDGIMWHSPALVVLTVYIAVAVTMLPAVLWGLPAVAGWVAVEESARRIRRRPSSQVRQHPAGRAPRLVTQGADRE